MQCILRIPKANIARLTGHLYDLDVQPSRTVKTRLGAWAQCDSAQTFWCICQLVWSLGPTRNTTTGHWGSVVGLNKEKRCYSQSWFPAAKKLQVTVSRSRCWSFYYINYTNHSAGGVLVRVLDLIEQSWVKGSVESRDTEITMSGVKRHF